MNAQSEERSESARIVRELGFEVLEWLGATASSRLCRALRLADGERALLRVQKAEPGTPAELLRFRAEYELIGSLTLPCVPRALAFLGDGPRPVIALADCPGRLLEAVLTGPMPLPQALSLGERLSDSLGAFHGAGFVHRDLRPVNVLVTSDDSAVQLVDLSGAASRDAPPFDESFRGEDLAYVSPEQTGRVRQAIDLRTYLYSLGVTLFRAFSGKLPFETADALELVHSHLARTPVSLSRLLPAATCSRGTIFDTKAM